MPTAAVQGAVAPTDSELVSGVRAGEDAAFEELYRRYHRRIAAFVRGLVRDEARTEDVTQEAFLSALRRLRATDSEIAFKPWIYEIARNAAIDLYRRTSRAEEISMDHDELLRPSDRGRLVGTSAPDSALFEKERMNNLRGALDELSDTHHRIIVMRELEGLSYREIGDRLELSRPAVESTLFRARRRLEREYEELEAGRRCEAITQAIARLAEGIESEADRRRLERHARRCSSCRRRARELGIEPLRRRRVQRAAATLPLPAVLRRRGSGALTGAGASGKAGGSALSSLLLPGAHFGSLLSERAATLVVAAALAGAGGAALQTMGAFDQHRSASGGPAQAIQQREGAPTASELETGQPPSGGSPTEVRPRTEARPGAPATRPEHSTTPGTSHADGPGLGQLQLPQPKLQAPRAPALPRLPELRPPDEPVLPPAGELVPPLELQVPSTPEVGVPSVVGGVTAPVALPTGTVRALPASLPIALP